MSLLLFFLSFLFTYVFYLFYSIEKDNGLISLSGNLFFETVIMFVIGIYLFVSFSSLFRKNTLHQIDNNQKIVYIVFFLLFFAIFLWFETSFLEVAIVLLFLFGEVNFNIFSNLQIFEEQKKGIRYFGLFFNYLSIIASIWYLQSEGISYFLIAILLYGAYFNYGVNRKYHNYISFMFAFISICFLVLYFFLKMYEKFV